MDYRELHQQALEQEQAHFRLVVAGQESAREKMEYWQGQRRKAAALWAGQRARPQDPDQAARPESLAESPEPKPLANVGVPCVRTYPDLSQCCLAQRLDLPLRLWYILRQHNSDVLGDGWLTESEIFNLSVGSKRQTRAWLRKGQGTFWHKHGDGFRLAGLGAVVEKLGIKLPKPCVPIPREHLESLLQFRAALYASWFTHYGADGITISQAVLAQLFGRSPRTLQRWAATAGLGVSHNLATAPLPESKDDVTRRYKNGMPRYPMGTLEAMGWTGDGDHQPGGKPNLVWFERVGNDLVLVWKMANTYSMAWQPGPKTTLQRNASKRAPVLRAAGANVCKMYFSEGAKGAAVAKAIERDQGPVYLGTGRTHDKTGDVLWSKQA